MKAISRNKKIINATAIILTLAMLLSAAGCTTSGNLAGYGTQAQVAQTDKVADTPSTSTATSTGPSENTGPTATAIAPVPDLSDPTTIELGESIVVSGSGVSVSGGTVTITAGGVYSLRGAMDDGQIIVGSADKKDVVLVLNGVDLTCSTSAPIYIMRAQNAFIVLAEGTTNRIADAEAYDLEAGTDEPNAAIFSQADLQISGNGALTVEASYNDAITSKDDLAITSGAITVHSVGDGLRGRDSLAITGGSIVVDAAGDALESNNDEDASKGLVTIEGGTLQITAGQDGIEAQTNVVVRGGEMTLVTSEGSANSSQSSTWGNWNRRPGQATSSNTTDDTPSAKGIKAGASVLVEAGVVRIDSSDDAIHSNGDVTINGGEIEITSGDDGIHADANVTINGGQIDIAKSYEGIEGLAIAIHEGTIHVVASDDGLNGAGGVDGSSVNGRPGQNRFGGSGNARLDITGGYLVVDASGDGLDINGAISMTDGVVIVNGPTNDGNGALDYDGGFPMTGGFLVAVGSAGMAQAPDASSTQHAVLVNLNNKLPAGTLVNITSIEGKEVLTFMPLRQVQSVVLCSPDLEKGTTYVVSTGGAYTGAATDGLYSGGAYTGGSEAARLTISSMVTSVGSVRGMRPSR